jgi:hypothetical protein
MACARNSKVVLTDCRIYSYLCRARSEHKADKLSNHGMARHIRLPKGHLHDLVLADHHSCGRLTTSGTCSYVSRRLFWDPPLSGPSTRIHTWSVPLVRSSLVPEHHVSIHLSCSEVPRRRNNHDGTHH